MEYNPVFVVPVLQHLSAGLSILRGARASRINSREFGKCSHVIPLFIQNAISPPPTFSTDDDIFL